MKKLITLTILLFSFIFTYAQHGWRAGEMEIRVKLENQDQIAKLAALHLNGDVYPAGYALMYVIPSELERVKEQGLEYNITKPDLNNYYKDLTGMLTTVPMKFTR